MMVWKGWPEELLVCLIQTAERSGIAEDKVRLKWVSRFSDYGLGAGVHIQ